MTLYSTEINFFSLKWIDWFYFSWFFGLLGENYFVFTVEPRDNEEARDSIQCCVISVALDR